MRLIVLLALLITLSACNLASEDLPTPNSDNLIVVTATPNLPTPNASGEILITATPLSNAQQPVNVQSTAQLPATLVLTSVLPATEVNIEPTIVPISNVDTNALLTTARQQTRNGQYAEVIQTTQNLINQGGSIDANARIQAYLLMGQAALNEGQFDLALTAYSDLINQYPNEQNVARAYFLRGDALLGLSRWAEAITDFERYLTIQTNLIDSYIYERIADAQLALGQTDLAIENYIQAINANRSLVPLLVLREKLAQILINVNRIDDAVAQYDAILGVARNAPYRASIELLATQTLVNAGRTQEAIPRAQRIFDTYPTTNSAYDAMQILVNNGTVIDGWRRGQVAYYYGNFNEAITAFNEYSSSFVLEAIPSELYLLLGRAYREIGNSTAAIVAFQTIIDQFPNDPNFGEALLEQGRTRFLANDIATAITTYLSIGDNFNYLPATASEALWRAGYLYGTNGDPVQSRQIFVRLADSYSQSEWASNGLFLAASAAVTNGESQVAENLYGRIASLTTGDDQAAAYMWVGRLALERGDTNAAQQAFTLAQTASPDSFFAARSSDILRGITPFEPPATVNFNFDEVRDRGQAIEWLRTTFSVTDTGDLSQLSATLQSDPRLVRGTELWAVGAFEEAVTEFGDLLTEKRQAVDAVSSFQLAIYFRDLGAYYSSIVAAADVIRLSGVSTLQAPPYIARMRYPSYFHELITEQADAYGFDPLLMLALIRQESLFQSTAVSSAFAYGLTQVIPGTGQYIADELNYPNFTPTDLWRPHVGIRFGAFYLDEQLRLFDGNAAAALAAYNAGPGRALDWVALSGGEVDLLVTTITFEETRSYVERIYSHYNIYRALYGF